jgi:hypothetical protein
MENHICIEKQKSSQGSSPAKRPHKIIPKNQGKRFGNGNSYSTKSIAISRSYSKRYTFDIT